MKRVIGVILILMCTLGASAQKLAIDSFAAAQGDLSASVYPRLDRNNGACGLVKVQLASQGATFEGSVVGDVAFRNNEYWVYMNQGAYLLRINHPDYVPLDINLHNHGLKDGVQAKTTYVLSLAVPTRNSRGPQFLMLKVEPAHAVVRVDGVQQMVTDGVAKVLLSQGVHRYQVEAPGYATEENAVTIGRRRADVSVSLKSVMARLTVSCATSGAEIYINDELKGTTSWEGLLPKGIYQVEARLKGYQNAGQSVTLSDNEQRRLTLPALQANTGSVSVDYEPVNAEVWMDGSRLGTTPNVFSDISVGSHRLEIRSAGYATYSQLIHVEEGNPVSLTGRLKKTKPSNTTTANTVTTNATTTNAFPASAFFATLGLYAWAPMAVGGSVGAYFSNVCVEATVGIGLSKSETIYWNPSTNNSATAVECTYKPMLYSIEVGYGMAAGRAFRLTPQVGATVVSINADGSKAHATTATLGVRTELAIMPHLSAYIAPKFGFAVAKSDVYQQLADVSSKVKSWAGGLGCRLGLCVWI